MAIKPTLQNLGVFFVSMYPIFIVSFLFVASIFNLKLNGLIYVLGILLTFGVCYTVAMLFDDERRKNDTSCDLFTTLGYHYKNPSFQAAVTIFTCIYLLIPMIMNNLLNPIVIVTTLFGSVFNMGYLKYKGCTSFIGLFMGSAIGVVMAMVMVGLLSLSNNKDLLFYNELVSNNAICSKPSKQKFKCTVYKGAELVSSSIV